MKNYVITTDATADYPTMLAEKDFYIIPMSYVIDGTLYDDIHNKKLSPVDFFNELQSGKFSSTSMVSHDQATEFFEKLLKEGNDIIHIAFPPVLSGCYDCYLQVAEELRVKYPERKFEVVDSRSASIGEGLLVWYALRNRDKGASYENELVYISDIRDNMGHIFTVDDPMHLYRGGRLKRTTAVVAKTLKIKPIITVNAVGELVQIGKVVGRKAAINYMTDYIKANHKGKQDMIFIQHADNLEDALALKQKVMEMFSLPDEKVVVDFVGPIIGSHLGKGTITMSFKSKERHPMKKFDD